MKNAIIIIAYVCTLRSDLLKRTYNVGLASLHWGRTPSDEFATGLNDICVVTPLPSTREIWIGCFYLRLWDYFEKHYLQVHRNSILIQTWLNFHVNYYLYQSKEDKSIQGLSKLFFNLKIIIREKKISFFLCFYRNIFHI